MEKRALQLLTLPKLILLLPLFTLFVYQVHICPADTIEAAPQTYLEDRVGVIEKGLKVKIINLLQILERKTGARIIVLIIDTTGGVPIEEYAFERADKWKFGKNQKSASALIVVSIKDRKYRFEIGYELEPILPDSYVGTIGRKYFVPYFKKGQYGEGLYLALYHIANRIAGAKGIKLDIQRPLMPTMRIQNPKYSLLQMLFALLPAILILALKISLIRRRRIWWMGPYYAGGYYGSGSPSGFGGFGSFGMGGGGGFGGGGASGSW